MLTATATWLETYRLTSDFGEIVVAVGFATTVIERLAGLAFLVEVIASKVALARTNLLGLLTGICQITSHLSKKHLFNFN